MQFVPEPQVYRTFTKVLQKNTFIVIYLLRFFYPNNHNRDLSQGYHAYMTATYFKILHIIYWIRLDSKTN